MGIRFLMFIIIIPLQLCFSRFSYGIDIITSSTNLSDGRTLVSSDGSFELGFFNLGSSGKSRYLGIWYRTIPVQNVVWVANRCNPINDSSGVLMINSTGNLVLLSQSVWASNSKKEAQNPILQLLDSGNLVLEDRIAGKSEALLWQSFDYPTDSWLPRMKFGWDLSTGLNPRLSAWKSPDDPCPGDLTCGIELYNKPDLLMWKGSRKYPRAGSWDGFGANGLRQPMPNLFFTFNVTSNEEEIYIIYHLKVKSEIARLVLNQTSSRLQITIWNEEASTWMVYGRFPSDDCDNYGTCGADKTCLDILPPCLYLKGFKFKSQEGSSVDWIQDCVRNKLLDCQKGDRFKKFGGLKLPDTAHSWVNESMDLNECRVKCLENCSCMAYTTLDIKENRGCAIWFDDLLDLKQLQSARQDLYVRM